MASGDKLTAGLFELENMDRAGLAAKWEALMHRPAPKASSRVFLLRALSFELQSGHAPDLSKSDQKVLKLCLGDDSQPAHETNKALTSDIKPKRPPARLSLVPGSRLVREWNGQAYTVAVIKEGFVYKDRTWSSLSAIAKDITGAHWSGPRFFGLDRAA